MGLYEDNTTALAYLNRQGCTRSKALNEEGQRILWWAKVHRISIKTQSLSGHKNVTVEIEWTRSFPWSGRYIRRCAETSGSCGAEPLAPFISVPISGSCGDGIGCLSLQLESPGAVHFSTNTGKLQGDQQAYVSSGHISHLDCSIMAQTGMVSRTPEVVS